MNTRRLLCILTVSFFFTDTPTTEIYTYIHTLSLTDALPIYSTPTTKEINHVHSCHFWRWHLFAHFYRRCRRSEVGRVLRRRSGCSWHQEPRSFQQRMGTFRSRKAGFHHRPSGQW